MSKPCILWKGAPNSSGYGGAWSSLQQRKVGAHVRSWEDAHGWSPSAGECVCHTCDVRLCVEPDHLFLGSHSDNTKDAIAKGRMPQNLPENRPRGPEHRARVKAKTPRGTKQHLAKLDASKVLDIRSRRLSDAEYAAEFGVSIPTVFAARKGKTWTHI